jgi:hypothetical protein
MFMNDETGVKGKIRKRNCYHLIYVAIVFYISVGDCMLTAGQVSE